MCASFAILLNTKLRNHCSMTVANTETQTAAKSSSTIGPWKLGETLGVGSAGKVRLAQHEGTAHKTAVKIISKSIFNTEGNYGNHGSVLPYNIEREIVIMKLLSHPNVLGLYDVWETNNNLYLILEYAEKGELFNLLVDRGALPEREAMKCFRQIIIAVSYCHALGIVHRDLKPENLLLDSDYNIKVADFGMAALQTDAALLETSCGSPHYAAPEIVSGLPYEGFSSDVWSCGVILFALLTGRLPFDEENGNIRTLLLKVQRGQFEMPDDTEISKDAQDLISKILVVDPAQRIKIRDILSHPLLKRYQTIKDSKSIKDLPREDTYLYPLADAGAAIDDSILQNLVVLWHGRHADEIKAKLKASGTNTEKTLYALLYRFKLESMRESNKRRRHKTKKTKNRKFSTSSSLVKGRNLESTPRKRTSKTHSNNFSSGKKRSSFILSPNSINSSPIPLRNSKGISLRNATSGGSPVVPVILLNSFKRNSKLSSKRSSYMPNLKSGSVTSRLLSNYNKLIDEDDWECIEKDTKRTSSNFATLIDEIFEPEEFELAKREKVELQRKVRGSKMSDNIGDRSEFTDGMKELKRINAKVSSPLINYEFSQQELLQDIDTLLTNRYQLSAYTRPISKLDPGLMPAAGTTPHDIKEQTALIRDTEVKIIETIHRSKFLGSLLNVREGMSKDDDELAPIEESSIISTTPLIYDDRTEVRKISDVEVPHFTRKSRHFTAASNRRSVLSLYSSRDSFKDLSQISKNEYSDSPSQRSVDDTSSSKKVGHTESLASVAEHIDDDSYNDHNSGMNSDNVLYDVPEGVDLPQEVKNSDEQSSCSLVSSSLEPTPVVELPSLSSFQGKNASGLGIYQREPSKVSLPTATIDTSDAVENRETEVKKELKHDSIATNLPDDNVKENNNATAEAPSRIKKSSNVSILKNISKGKILELEIHAKIPNKRLFEGLHKLLEGWKQYGLKKLGFDAAKMIIKGKLVNDSILSLRSTLFEIIVLPNGDDRSLIKFNKKTGSSKVLTKLATEIQIILQKEGVLDK
ncbi:serine/threonine protein kinase SKDI_03G0480 [Saccharomyces kudriavzevii IFO 1802]|uniref:Uncharacterized protein n=2 Tax=Saccharomyces kudriavzevii (strain ATCC MYA-4449 / AS 2.2408 / CBS 8840 / NBRC 1802 / NCYC 2889) TaxID=226230 RepID=A0AA35JCI7_SACK1|nr:uncharacterized protein SKDI_03G0480 [Saccharomyces kudriavzevii IFO 1802]EJT42903.1 KCC4-like protein [Saccharomyces kudriavzevii IFO 1802]CAI4056489.1 hypothetical protein SKDI_03G0480 [Saccharomyces kudriavzevii IFO 1802]